MVKSTLGQYGKKDGKENSDPNQPLKPGDSWHPSYKFHF
jgi:hypothetical protein